MGLISELTDIYVFASGTNAAVKNFLAIVLLVLEREQSGVLSCSAVGLKR